MKQLIIIILGIIVWLVAQHYFFKWVDKENKDCIAIISGECIK